MKETYEVASGQIVTVTVQVDDAPSTQTYPSELDWAAVRAERDEARERSAQRERRVEELEADLERYRRAHVCTSRCSEKSHVAFEGVRLVRELESERAAERQRADQNRSWAERAEARLADSWKRVEEMETLFHEATRRANENRDWAERAETRLAAEGLKLADAERAVQILSDQLGKVHAVAHGQEIRVAMSPVYLAPETTALRNAILQIRDALGSPSLPGPPRPFTSQA